MRGTSYGADEFVLYGHPISAPSYKVALMLALCGQEFEFRHVNLFALEQKAPAFRDVNRYGQVPALSHGPLNLCQSDAILMHLSEHLGRFGGEDVLARARIREWLFWEHDRLMPGIQRAGMIRSGIREAPADVEAYHRTDAIAALKIVARQLHDRDWLVGHAPSIADISIHAILHFAAGAGHDLAADWPAIAAHGDRIRALPGWAAPEALMPAP